VLKFYFASIIYEKREGSGSGSRFITLTGSVGNLHSHGFVESSVADPGCLSRIPDPKTATKERGQKKFVCQTFFCSHKFHKIKNYFIF
jgi:hypothetical protein